MSSPDQIARLGMIRLQAGIARAGFTETQDVAFKLQAGDDDPTQLACQICGIDQLHGDEINSVRLERRYGPGEGPTHIVTEAELVSLPDGVLETLVALREKLASERATLGWMIGVDRSSPDRPRVTLRLTSSDPAARRRRIDGSAHALSEALGVEVSLEIGAIPQLHGDHWANKPHKAFAPGMSIGSAALRTKGGTITMPVRLRTSPLDRYFLTAGHLLPEDNTQWQMRQPADYESQDRQTGVAERLAYESSFDAINYFDAALVRALNQLPRLEFGSKDKFQLLGVSNRTLIHGDHAYIYGASKGFVGVRIQYTDVETTMLSTIGNRLIYRDAIEFSFDEDNTQAASFPGDSGAPLLIGKDNQYYVAGIVIGGGSQTGGSGKARSYAVPIQRVLDHFQVEPL